MAEIKKKDDIIQISLFWPDLKKKTQNEIRNALKIPAGEDNNWTYIPMAMMEISEDVIDEE